MTKVKCTNELCGHWKENICTLNTLELVQLADNGCTYIICTSFTEGALGIDDEDNLIIKEAVEDENDPRCAVGVCSYKGTCPSNCIVMGGDVIYKEVTQEHLVCGYCQYQNNPPCKLSLCDRFNSLQDYIKINS